MSEIFRIRLKDMRFYSRIGVLEEERVLGNKFDVDVELEIDGSEFINETLERTVNYAEVYEIVKGEMGKNRMLLESTAKAISESLKMKWGNILRSKVEITKVTVPIPGFTGEAGVTLVRDYE